MLKSIKHPLIKKIIIVDVVLAGLWLTLLGPLAPWQVVTYSNFDKAKTPSALFGEYTYSLEVCKENLKQQLNKKESLKLFNESTDSFGFAPGKADPDEYVILDSGFCGKGCFEWSLSRIFFGITAKDISCWAKAK